jgi:hypothetical protein
MSNRPLRRALTALAIAGALALGTGGTAHAVVADTPAPAELAAKISGTWKLNTQLSPDIGGPGPGREGRGGAPSLAIMGLAAQRGGGGGGGGGGRGRGGGEARGEAPYVVPAEAAAQAALSLIQQVPVELTIAATASNIRIVDPRGESQFEIDGKNASVPVPGGGTLHVKSKWDRTGLRQEFSSTQRAVRRSWSVDANDRLLLSQRLESLAVSVKEFVAVFDRQ